MRNLYKHFLGWMVAVIALLATSCTENLMLDSALSGEEVTVSFTVTPQDVMGGTRAGEELTHISDGKKANMLIYAIYDEDNTLLPQYGEGLQEELKRMLEKQGITEPTLGKGQTAIYVEKFPIENRILIRLLRGKTYKVAFWAQSLECKAYDTRDLKKVEVIYGADKDGEGKDIETPNNDERRDVFCQVATVNTNNKEDLNKDVTLYRPLAQINVGTSGYDFEAATRGQNSKKYRYSRIQISSAARYFSVPENKVLTSTVTTDTDDDGITTEARATLNYDFAPIPAYYNYNEDIAELDPSTVIENEEYLRVDLDKSEDITGYVSFDDYKKNNSIEGEEERKEANYTETFKYLSMCYILVPVQEDNADFTKLPTEDQEEHTTLLDNVTVWLAESEDDKNPLEIVSLTNVPVHRNWRTNILSQELLTTGVDLKIDLEPMYSGDYNTDDWGNTWSGPLAQDVYYDAINDEILISGYAGLKWLERMVNGKYEYGVYGTNGKTYTFKDNGIADPTLTDDSDEAKALKARIMRATHQDQNGGKWPENNNFHFMGAKLTNDDGTEIPASSRYTNLVYPAKVRLMADIDLEYKDWIPIGFANNTAETYSVFDEKRDKDVRAFCGEFDGGNHTIYHLKNKRFGASVYDADGYQQTTNKEPYDKAVQWFSVGLFGQIGQNGSVSNLRLKDVDLQGYCHVGAIAGTVTGQEAFIYNCYVDGGTITAAPMYRGDSHRKESTENGRTFARGIYAGGIVGYLNVGRGNSADKAWNPSNSDFRGDANDPNLDKYSSVLNCDVRNLTLRAYRQIGGIVGALNNNDKTNIDENGEKANAGNTRRVRKISNNNVTNVTIIADKFQPYDIFFSQGTKNGFGWKENQLAWSDIFVGGNPENNKSENYILNSASLEGNTASKDVIITEFATGIATGNSNQRTATIDMIPLNLMPMLSSFFTDNVTLLTNFTGTHSAYKKYKEHQFYSDSRYQKDTQVNVPCDLPNSLNVDWDTESGSVGMYIESIILNGNNENDKNHDRTIVTVEDVKGENDCVAYIGGRDHTEYEKVFTQWNNHNTIINSMMFRGHPYAYTGICLAPTSSTASIELNNVAVYDVYQTLTLENGVTPSATMLKVTGSNLRGYTNYGAGWKSVTFENTVFERGANITGASIIGDNIQTCDVKTSTTFTNCNFKAPYTIKIAQGVEVTFNGCKAESTAEGVDIDGAKINDTSKEHIIKITSDLHGNPVVTYDDEN